MLGLRQRPNRKSSKRGRSASRDNERINYYCSNSSRLNSKWWCRSTRLKCRCSSIVDPISYWIRVLIKVSSRPIIILSRRNTQTWQELLAIEWQELNYNPNRSLQPTPFWWTPIQIFIISLIWVNNSINSFSKADMKVGKVLNPKFESELTPKKSSLQMTWLNTRSGFWVTKNLWSTSNLGSNMVRSTDQWQTPFSIVEAIKDCRKSSRAILRGNLIQLVGTKLFLTAPVNTNLSRDRRLWIAGMVRRESLKCLLWIISARSVDTVRAITKLCCSLSTPSKISIRIKTKGRDELWTLSKCLIMIRIREPTTTPL